MKKCMTYEEFGMQFLERLQELYGENALVTKERVLKNNDQYLEGIRVQPADHTEELTPVFYLEELYQSYQDGMELEECVRRLCQSTEEASCQIKGKALTKKFLCWEEVKKNVYPLLLPTKKNEELLKSVVSLPMLDLSILYMIRTALGEGQMASVKISRELFRQYGISMEELHQEALRNLERDGYKFQSMWEMIKGMMPEEAGEEIRGEEKEGIPMYVLTNREKVYGAAGILDQKLLREFAGGRSFYILPSSLHETIFVPAEYERDGKVMDAMVAEVNETQVSEKEQLSDHSYYYDGESGEIRMCA